MRLALVIHGVLFSVMEQATWLCMFPTDLILDAAVRSIRLNYQDRLLIRHE